MAKIYFHVDEGSMPLALWDNIDEIDRAKSYEHTEELIRCGAEIIHTTDMCHFSFDLIDMGYEIYLCYKGKRVKIEPDMTIEPIGKHLKRGHNIRKLFIGHAFDDMLGIEDKKSAMQPKFLVSDEVVCEMTVRKVEEVRYSTEFNSYMYKLDKGGWFLESALKPNVQGSKKANFKVGDFICHKYNSIYGDCRQICDISGDSYLCTVPNSVAATCSISFSEQGNWRLWDAANDAKDGDVLALDGSVFIYAHRKQLYDIAVSHCFVNQYGEFFLDGEFGYTECGVQVLPATKEQRVLLFTKMREIGYEWDEKKKELKKIRHYDIANFHTGMPVLVREYDTCVWQWVQYSHFNGVGLFFAAGKTWRQYIPFNEDTKHLLGTTDMPDEMYINWR